MMCDLACDEIAERIRAASGAPERADLSSRGKGEGGKKSQDGSKRCQDGEAEGMLLLCDVIARVNTRTSRLQ